MVHGTWINKGTDHLQVERYALISFTMGPHIKITWRSCSSVMPRWPAQNFTCLGLAALILAYSGSMVGSSLGSITQRWNRFLYRKTVVLLIFMRDYTDSGYRIAAISQWLEIFNFPDPDAFRLLILAVQTNYYERILQCICFLVNKCSQ